MIHFICIAPVIQYVDYNNIRMCRMSIVFFPSSLHSFCPLIQPVFLSRYSTLSSFGTSARLSSHIQCTPLWTEALVVTSHNLTRINKLVLDDLSTCLSLHKEDKLELH